ncbi:MAG: 2-amino-4-hydroxy-6-hydroxymethyldihydropteridine diphosphokinase [Gammaproteobacteria bacterium]|nr:2-amino-4-hydroxy-6-hydroxymethyldihydropteridine diphosphokinase [Gammaproteobacteria bacterium]
MPDVYLGLGSNVEPGRNLRLCVRELGRRFELLKVSTVYRNGPVGFEGNDFLNAVAFVRTEKSPAEIMADLSAIHDLAGRKRGDVAFVSRTLDIDLLLYGDEVIGAYRVPRKDVLEYSFVLGPLAEISPDLRHPVTGRSMAEHWAEFDRVAHPLTAAPGILSNRKD